MNDPIIEGLIWSTTLDVAQGFTVPVRKFSSDEIRALLASGLFARSTHGDTLCLTDAGQEYGDQVINEWTAAHAQIG